MPLLSRRERRNLITCRLSKFFEMERQFELVTEFYPARRLTIFVDVEAIMAIKNCDTNKALKLLRKIWEKEGYVYSPAITSPVIRTSVFCYYMNIDPMLIQVFLASLDTFQEPLPPTKRLAALTRDEILAGERPRKAYEIAAFVNDGIMENSKTLAIRAKLWEEANPMGEAMACREKWVQMVIRAFEVAQIYRCHIDTAREMLREVREKERKEFPESKLRRSVSIKKFCAVHNEDEEDLRRHLAILHGYEDGEAGYD
jgi:hypothetical protein